MIVRIIWMHMAPSEWGSELMDKVAAEEFEKRGYPEDVLIEVSEHAGWSLSYIWDVEASRTVVVESANDRTVFRGRAKEWRDKVTQANLKDELEYKYLGCVRREEPSKA